MNVLLQLLGIVVMLIAIAPVAMAGGRMIAAFMMRKQIVAWLVITLAAMAAVVAGGLLALHVLQPWIKQSVSQTLEPLSSLAMLAPPWAVYWIGRHVVDGKSEKEVN